VANLGKKDAKISGVKGEKNNLMTILGY